MRAVQDRLEQGDAPYQPRDYFKRLAPFWLIVTDYEWMLNSGGEPFWFGPSPDPERIATPAVMAYFKSEAGYSPPWLSTPDISAEAPIASDGDEATAEHQPSRKKKRRQLIGGKTLEERLEKGTEQWCGKVENQLAGLYAGRHRESHKRR
ncbi:hypothetical protein EJ08DRAFT_731023 [Tothia fuscella]|uniref:Uncharacterized protein n=1 Tax=Tothia fuscella TaxID=1048955 RepID=A0A9P4NZ65_9PEZI|nr:hypothetical protein EJ08DRAFT_731023 [Tothia fuscella]